MPNYTKLNVDNLLCRFVVIGINLIFHYQSVAINILCNSLNKPNVN